MFYYMTELRVYLIRQGTEEIAFAFYKINLAYNVCVLFSRLILSYQTLPIVMVRIVLHNEAFVVRPQGFSTRCREIRFGSSRIQSANLH